MQNIETLDPADSSEFFRKRPSQSNYIVNSFLIMLVFIAQIFPQSPFYTTVDRMSSDLSIMVSVLAYWSFVASPVALM